MKIKTKEYKSKYRYAYDKKLNRRVVHVLLDGYLISLVTGARQKFTPPKRKRRKNEKKN